MLDPGDCGGCQGLGSHKRWCEVAVGRAAAMYGRLAEAAEDLGDRIGGNEPGAANHCYAASGLLRQKAIAAKIRYMEAITEETRRLDNLDFG